MDNDCILYAGIPSQLTEDYVNLVGDVMYPKSTFHYAEATPAEGKVEIERDPIDCRLYSSSQYQYQYQ
jgi:hypothetical protein